MPKFKKASYFRPDLNSKPTEWSSVSEKKNFITKVYRIFIYSLLFSAITAYAGIQLDFPFSWWWVAFEFAIFLICIFSKNSLLLLYLWTSISGFTSAPILSKIISEGQEDIIWQAILLAVLLFGILSVYVHYTKKDFSAWRCVLFALLALSVLSIIPRFLFPNNTAEIIWTISGIFVFSGYVLLDTSNIIHRYKPGDETMAALDLHLDFINIFWDFLGLFKKKRSESPVEIISDIALESDGDIIDLLD